MSAEVIPLGIGPSLLDLASQLRELADEIDAGEWGDDPTGIVLIPRDGRPPACFGWGPNTSRPEVAFALAQAITFLAGPGSSSVR